MTVKFKVQKIQSLYSSAFRWKGHVLFKSDQEKLDCVSLMKMKSHFHGPFHWQSCIRSNLRDAINNGGM